MKILLDTSVCIHLLRRRASDLERVMAFRPRDVAIPAHAVTELDHGVYLGQYRKQARLQVDFLLSKYRVLAFDSAVARCAALLLYDTARQGLTMKFFDLMIAAHAIETGLTLATADSDFEALSGARGLRVPKWV